MSGKVALGFVPEPRSVPVEQLLPSRKVPVGIAASRKYRQLVASISEVGLIEPLTVSLEAGDPPTVTVLDGHTRLMALKELGATHAPCLQALDDESYTYNNRLNRLSSVQEHYMIKRAIDRGVSAERLARALSLDLSQIQKKGKLLDGLCNEVVGMLADRQFSTELSRVLRKMKPTRQVECVELMVSANNTTVAYAEALLAATPPELVVGEAKPKKLGGVTREQMARMEREMSNLHGQYKLVEQSYGQDVLTLVLVRGYLIKLLANATVVRYLRKKSPEILEQFQALREAPSLEGG
jgi:ParB-like chromosome segregation protein Spo0J